MLIGVAGVRRNASLVANQYVGLKSGPLQLVMAAAGGVASISSGNNVAQAAYRWRQPGEIVMAKALSASIILPTPQKMVSMKAR